MHLEINSVFSSFTSLSKVYYYDIMYSLLTKAIRASTALIKSTNFLMKNKLKRCIEK